VPNNKKLDILFLYVLQRGLHIFNSFEENKQKLLLFGIKRLQRHLLS